jgi:hypothetical protein
MSKLSSTLLGAPQDLFISTTVQGTDPGSVMTTGDGRYFQYSLVGATALVPGTVLQGPARIANHLQLSPTAAVAATVTANTGAPLITASPGVLPQITVTLGATAVTANYYAYGTLNVTLDAGTGGQKGYQYQIISHPAAAASATLTLTLSDQIQNLITTSALIDLVPNANFGVIVYPTTATGVLTGVAVTTTPATQWGWIQVSGNASVLNDAGGAITVGNLVVPSTSVAGAVKSLTGTLPVIGVAATGGTASQNFTVNVSNLT